MYVQPRVVGYAPFQATGSRATAILPAGRRQRCLSTSSVGVSNHAPSTSRNRPSGFSRGESSTHHHRNVHIIRDPLSNENVPFVMPCTCDVSGTVSAASGPTRSGSWNWPSGAARGEGSSHHRNARNTQDPPRNENVPFVPPRTVCHPPQQLARTHTRERAASRAPRPQDPRPRYPAPDFFRAQFTDTSKYAAHARIATHFVSDRFPAVPRDHIHALLSRIFYMTRDRPNVAYGALLLLLQRLRVMAPRWLPDDSEVPGFPGGVLLCAYVVARKVILDETVQNRALVRPLELPFDVRVLNRLERALMQRLDYNLTIDAALLAAFTRRVKRDFGQPAGQYPRYSWDVVSKTDPRADRFRQV